MLDFNELLKKPEFEKLDSQMIETVKKAFNEIQGKSQVEQMGIIMRYCQNFTNSGKMSKDERDAMIALLIENMPEGDRERMKKLANMIK